MNTIATRLCLIWSALLLTGCIYQTVNSNDIEAGVIICAANGAELVSVDAYFIGAEEVACSNRESYTIKPDNLPKKGTV